MALRVQYLAVNNSAAFVLSFKVKAIAVNDDGTDGFLGDSGVYPINQTRVIDVSQFGIPEGTLVTPQVSAVLGVSNEGDKKCQYEKNGQTATYLVAGTTLSFSVRRVGA